MTKVSVLVVIPSQFSGGVGGVCRYSAAAIADLADWDVTLLCLHDPVAEQNHRPATFRTVCLGLRYDGIAAEGFLDWLSNNPHDVCITNDVAHIEAAFPYLPNSTRHIVQLHDFLRRYRMVPVRNAAHIDGVSCVADHIEQLVRPLLRTVKFDGLISTNYNGAAFPKELERHSPEGALRLLFMGRPEPRKGIDDLPLILSGLHKRGERATLTIAGGVDNYLGRRFKKLELEEWVHWAGQVPHRECYRLAATHDVLLMCSRKESFGMVTIEAMSMGCVPIAYDIPSGSTELIEHDVSGLLVPMYRRSSFIDHIIALARDPVRCQRLSRGATCRARIHFDDKSAARQMINFINKVLARPCAPRLTGRPNLSIRPLQILPRYNAMPAGLRATLHRLLFRSPIVANWVLKWI